MLWWPSAMTVGTVLPLPSPCKHQKSFETNTLHFISTEIRAKLLSEDILTEITAKDLCGCWPTLLSAPGVSVFPSPSSLQTQPYHKTCWTASLNCSGNSPHFLKAGQWSRASFMSSRLWPTTNPCPQVLLSRSLNRSRASATHYLQPAPVRVATGAQQEEADLGGWSRFFMESRRASGSSWCKVWHLTTEQKSGIWAAWKWGLNYPPFHPQSDVYQREVCFPVAIWRSVPLFELERVKVGMNTWPSDSRRWTGRKESFNSRQFAVSYHVELISNSFVFKD